MFSLLQIIFTPLIIALVVLFQVHFGAFLGAKSPGDCLMVMGSKVLQNGKPDLMMRERVQKAAEVYQDSYHAVIVTGGSIDPQVKEESAVLKQELIKRGVPPERIWEEDQSTSTYENLVFSKPILEAQTCSELDVVSHAFHLARVKLTAERLEIPVHRLVAASSDRDLSSQVKREYMAYLVYWLAWVLMDGGNGE